MTKSELYVQLIKSYMDMYDRGHDLEVALQKINIDNVLMGLVPDDFMAAFQDLLEAHFGKVVAEYFWMYTLDDLREVFVDNNPVDVSTPELLAEYLEAVELL